jgi:hypothetical protein
MTLLELLQGARDYSQGASNAVASTVSVPIDGLAFALRQAGMKGVDKPVMGSDWMREKGLTSEPVTSLAGMFGEAAGNVVPLSVLQRLQLLKGKPLP